MVDEAAEAMIARRLIADGGVDVTRLSSEREGRARDPV
jgi:hypothetical protein